MKHEVFLYFIESGKKRKGEIANCQFCLKEFIRRASTNKGKKKQYCSSECSSKAQSNKIKVSCDFCSTSFLRTPSKIRSQLKFCSKSCKDAAQKTLEPKFDSLRRTKQEGSCSDYISKCKKIKEHKCEGCSESRECLLTVHHIDGNRKNNPIDGSNWELLCYNCHALRHLVLNKDGEWTFNTKFLTPRDKIAELTC